MDAVFEIGSTPPIDRVPKEMLAQVIRRERFGEPGSAFQIERVPTPKLGDKDVLVYVMAAGINYNNVWAARGIPIDIIADHQRRGETEDFHIGGSDASGIVYATGCHVDKCEVGDNVVIHAGVWDDDDQPTPRNDPMLSSTARIYGYDTNYGSFAQFTRVREHQILPKPEPLSWAEAASYMLVGATAYRMLRGWPPNVVGEGDAVLVWGGGGGLGTQAIQIINAFGGRAVGVVSSDERARYCRSLGAVGTVDRRQFDHWGAPPHWSKEEQYGGWFKSAKGFGKAIWSALGQKISPRIVFEHPGEDTIPTSLFVCDTGGMVVICAGTTGYSAVVDLRYLWTRQKRLQGSHYANTQQASEFNNLVRDRKVRPTVEGIYAFEEIPSVHQAMYENRLGSGNATILIGARTPEAGRN